METAFYALGIGLVVAALVLSFVGLRWDAFPASKGLMSIVVAALTALVLATGAFAWMQAEDEQDHREAELAAEEAEAEEEAAEAPEGQQEAPSRDAGETLAIASPADGSLVFDPDRLTAKAGSVTIAYENPSEVPHNVAIDGESGQLAQSETGTGDTFEATAELEPGDYAYYCSVPGHREAGMEGALSVK